MADGYIGLYSRMLTQFTTTGNRALFRMKSLALSGGTAKMTTWLRSSLTREATQATKLREEVIRIREERLEKAANWGEMVGDDRRDTQLLRLWVSKGEDTRGRMATRQSNHFRTG